MHSAKNIIISKLYDGVQLRLTARTRGSAKAEILVSELEKKQTDQVKNTRADNKKKL